MIKLKEKTSGRLFMLATAVLWGLAGVCVKSIPWNPVSIMAARCAIGIIMLGFAKKSFVPHFTKRTFSGALMMSATGLLYMMSIKLTTAGTAIVLQYVAPILVFLFTVIVQKVKPKLSEALIVLAVFGGIVLSFADGLDSTRIAGNALGLLSGVTFAAQLIIFSDKRANPAEGMYLSNLISFVVCLPFMFFDKAMCFDGKTLFWVAVLGIFQYGLANICYSKGCTRVDKVEGSLLLTVEPIFNPIPVWIVTGEKMGPLSLAGFAVVISGVTLYALLPKLSEHKKSVSAD